METRSQRKLHTFPFSYLWAGKEYTIHSRYNGSRSKWKSAMKADVVWPTNKENTKFAQRSPCKGVYSKVMLLKSSLKKVSTWTLIFQRKERQYTLDIQERKYTQERKSPRLQEWSWREVEREKTLKITQSPISIWKTSLNLEFSQLCWCHALAVFWYYIYLSATANTPAFVKVTPINSIVKGLQ